MTPKRLSLPCALLLALSMPAELSAEERAGTFKAVNGTVTIDRGGNQISASLGDAVMTGDTVSTQASSFAAITMSDGTRLTAGPESELEIADYAFNTRTQAGRLDANVNRGSLAVISGALSKSSPDAVKFNTGSMTLGVRGTEFIIEASGSASE